MIVGGVKGRKCMIMVIFMKELGSKGKGMEEGCIYQSLEKSMREIGEMIEEKEKGDTFGLMEHSMKEIGSRIRGMVAAS